MVDDVLGYCFAIDHDCIQASSYLDFTFIFTAILRSLSTDSTLAIFLFLAILAAFLAFMLRDDEPPLGFLNSAVSNRQLFKWANRRVAFFV
jgi:hypothetical protein